MSPIQSNGGLTAGYSVVQATWDLLCAGLSFPGGESENNVLLDGRGLLAWVGIEMPLGALPASGTQPGDCCCLHASLHLLPVQESSIDTFSNQPASIASNSMRTDWKP